MLYTDIKFLNLLSVQLSRFKQVKRNLWNFRCPVCGDSQKNKTKARGYVFELKGNLMYKCHNCQVSLPFPALLQNLNPTLHKEYKLEKFKNNNTKNPVDHRKVKKIVSQKPVFKKDVLSDLTPLDKLNKTHPAREYILNRKLPTEALYYTEKFQEWVNSVKPDTFPDTSKDEARIIIPFIDRKGNCFGIQGRSIRSDGLRYITILFEEDRPKIFGLNTLDYERTTYICEGPLDSLLLDNAVAMAGADLSARELIGGDLVFIYDNEPRNKQITSRIHSHIKSGDSVVIWPKHLKEKDINDMILAGHNVQRIVEENTYSGLKATLKFTDWIK